MSSFALTQELLERYHSGDLEAEEQLFARYRELLLKKAAGHPITERLAPAVSPEDVVQEVFWRALSAGILKTFENRGRGALGGMLGTILYRTLFDMARRLGSSKRGADVAHTSLPGHAGESLPVGVGSASPTSVARGRDLLRFCRARLEPVEWEVWKAVELDGRPKNQVAETLGMNSKTLNLILHRAKRKLVAAIQHEESIAAIAR
jgi:RNA polymerase sigma factor (sigma-70 family)